MHRLTGASSIEKNPLRVGRLVLERPELLREIGDAVFTFNIVAPNTAGTYNFQWQMIQENGTGWFGAPTTNIAVSVTGVNRAQYVYDELGRLVQSIAPNGASAQYTYSPAGNLTSIVRQGVTTVAITEFTPNGGPVGTPVTIQGTGYVSPATGNTVKFNGVTATVTAGTETSLTTTVPAGATTGPITVANTSGTGTSLINFTVGANSTAAPTITSFSPLSAVAGTAVTITGIGFQTLASDNQVRFGTWAATVASANATTIVTTVPAAEASGKVSVTTPYGTATSTADFYAVPSGTLAADVEVTKRLTIGAAATPVTTTVAGKKILLTFDATQGQWLSLALTGGNFAGPITATAYRLDGSVLATKVVTNNDRLDMRLPASGTYTILLAPGATDKGTINAQLKAAVTGTLTTGAFSTVTVPAGQMGVYTFTPTPGTMLLLDISNVTISGGATVTMVMPDGTPLGSATVSSSSGVIDVGLARFAGPYAVIVQPAGIGSGNATLRLGSGLPDLIVTPPTVGAIAVNQDGSYSFPVTFTVTNSGGSAAQSFWEDACYLSSDATLGTGDLELGKANTNTPLAAGGNYSRTVTCTTRTTTAPGAYSLIVKADTLFNYDGSGLYGTYLSFFE